MHKVLLILVSCFLISTSVSAQQSLPAQYGEKMQELLGQLPKADDSKKDDSKPESLTASLLSYAKTLIGVPYRYASSNPKIGFDCSGFVNYVFKHIGVKVPRSSSAFKNVGGVKKLENVKVGDVLLFTGSNPKIRQIGHVGIVYSIGDEGIKFIHSSSGKKKGVVISKMDTHYKTRFMQGVSILE